MTSSLFMYSLPCSVFILKTEQVIFDDRKAFLNPKDLKKLLICIQRIQIISRKGN